MKALALLLITSPVFAADWPTFLHDAQRTSATTETIKPPLKLAWKSGPPEGGTQAWPDEAKRDEYRAGKALVPRFSFDRANHVAVVGEHVFFGSAQSHWMRCADAATGAVKWTFFTDGPVRIAPSVFDGKVYFGSDDGSAYCIDAAKGTSVWKHTPAGSGNKLLPNDGRFVSPWAIRTGVIVDKDTAYFGAGLFPLEGVLLCAVDARTGGKTSPEHWEHRVENEFTPQGAIVLSNDHVFLPAGRSTPWMLDRATGKVAGQFKDKKSGMGSFAMLLGDTLLYGPADRGGSVLTQAGLDFKAVGLMTGASAAAVTTDRLYIVGEKGLAAVNRESKGVEWSAKISQPACVIVAGETVFTGGDGEIRAFEAKTGRELALMKCDGRILGLAAANGRLFASNDRGQVFVFAAE